MKSKIKSSERLNRRYLLIEGIKEEIEKTILDYIGILGWAKASPVFIDEKGKVILAVERESLEDVRAAFAVGKDKIKVIKVSGMIDGLGK